MKNVILTACALLLTIMICQAQEKKDNVEKKKDIHLSIKDGATPDIYIDGKKFDFPIELLNKDKIESFKIIKGDEALKEYNAKNGVVLIKTKDDLVELDKEKIKIKAKDAKKEPIVIIDGIKSDRKALEKLNPDRIKSINVVKGEKALVEYNAPNGAVIVITKKGKK